MGFSYLKSRLVQVHPYSTLCLNKFVSHSHHCLVENTTNSSSCIYGVKHINPYLLLGSGRGFYHANPYPFQVYIARTSWWQWLRTRKYGFINISIILTILCASLERVPYSNRLHLAKYSDKLEGVIGWLFWKKREWEYEGRILPPTHPQSVHVLSILREIVQAMHTGLVLEHDCNVSGFVPKSERYGSEGTLLVSMVHQDTQKRPNNSIIKFGTRNLEGLNWKVMVVDSYRDNAEYLPNGKIVIYTGLLDFCNSDAEVATVLGHEVGHGVARHAAEHLMRVLWTVSLACPFLHWFPLVVLSRLLYMYISRRRELEADYIGLMLMASAGYDPQVAPKYYERLGDSEENWLSTHPSGERRARLLNENKAMGEALAIYKEARSGQRVKCFV